MRRFWIRLLTGFLASSALVALGASHLRADVIPQLQSVNSAAGGAFTWSYDATTTSSQSVNQGDYFAIMDFKGFTGAHSEPDGWTFSTSLSGPTPTGLIVKDDPTASNLIWTYTGTGSSGPLADLGQFSANSTIGTQGLGTFEALATRTDGINAGSKISNVGPGTVPVSLTPPIPAGGEVPEPTALAVLGLGMPVALGFWLRRKRMAVA